MPEERLELSRLAAMGFESIASAIPPLRHWHAEALAKAASLALYHFLRLCGTVPPETNLEDRMHPNLVEVKFFHVGDQGTTLESLVQECEERMLDSLDLERSEIATVVRFFDTSGKLTKLAQRAEMLGRLDAWVLRQFFRSTGAWRWCLDRYSRYLAGQKLALRDRTRRVAATQLRAVIRTSPVALELSNDRFRLVRDDEAHELVEKVEHAKNAWVFVFKANDLFSASNTLIASTL